MTRLISIPVLCLSTTLLITALSTAQADTPVHDPSQADLGPTEAAPEAPAAPDTTGPTIAAPKADAELKQRMAAARRQLDVAREALEGARAEQARAIHQGLTGAAKEAIDQREAAAQQAFEKAFSAIPPLVDEARQAAVDETVIQMYEQMTTQRP